MNRIRSPLLIWMTIAALFPNGKIRSRLEVWWSALSWVVFSASSPTSSIWRLGSFRRWTLQLGCWVSSSSSRGLVFCPNWVSLLSPLQGKRTLLYRLVLLLAMALHLAVLTTNLLPFCLEYTVSSFCLPYRIWFDSKPGGFGSYLIAMDEKTYKLIGPDYPGNRAEDVINPGLGWMTGFLFIVSFLGLFSLVPLRKVLLLSFSF